MSKQRLQRHAGLDMNIFMVKRGPSARAPPPRPPQRPGIYEDIPKIIIIALLFQAAATCVMIAFVALQTPRPPPLTRPARAHRTSPLPPHFPCPTDGGEEAQPDEQGDKAGGFITDGSSVCSRLPSPTTIRLTSSEQQSRPVRASARGLVQLALPEQKLLQKVNERDLCLGSGMWRRLGDLALQTTGAAAL
ncbi:unnamed protein product [Pleuronectes platessa]|uniref:Uncharacterized protein n=1 Tax=Pleuronectes platessa TaxID=8262 RepID=A0A9N7TLW3_PLEPL|nr:unnamed protein product [Pleuronectes platessa]